MKSSINYLENAKQVVIPVLISVLLTFSVKCGKKVKEEPDREDISIEYSDITRRLLKVPKIDPKISITKTIQLKSLKDKLNKKLNKIINVKVETSQNKNVQLHKAPVKNPTTTLSTVVPSNVMKVTNISTLKTVEINNEKVPVCSNNVNYKFTIQNHRKEPVKSISKASTSNSVNEQSSPRYARPVQSLPFNDTRFLQAQNSVLQSLLKDIITLNNEKDEVDELVLNREIANLRSKNNLPSLNAEVSTNLVLEDSDCSEVSEDESNSYYDPRSSENYGKDSGYDNESQYSGSLEDDNTTEVHQDNSRNGERTFVLAEPEYIDLDNYFGKKRKYIPSKESLMGIKKTSKNAKANNFNGLTCLICNKVLKTKKIYKIHTKNCTGCVKQKLFDCIGPCKFFGTEDGFLKHKDAKHYSKKRESSSKSAVRDKNELLFSCEKCQVTFFTNISLQRHYKDEHKQEMACLFCEFVCDNLTEYNLHISRKHSKRDKKDSSSDSDSLEIVEINDDD